MRLHSAVPQNEGLISVLWRATGPDSLDLFVLLISSH